MAYRVGRGIALLFIDRGTRRGVSGQQHALAALYPPQRPGTHFTGIAVAQWVRCCATNQKVAGLIPAGVIGIFH